MKCLGVLRFPCVFLLRDSFFCARSRSNVDFRRAPWVVCVVCAGNGRRLETTRARARPYVLKALDAGIGAGGGVHADK